MSSVAQLKDVLKTILGIDVLSCSHEAQLTDNGERGFVGGCDGRDEVIDALGARPRNEPFHSLGRIALTPVFG